MNKKYKHIKLPKKMISQSEVYIPHVGWGKSDPLPKLNHKIWGRRVGTKLGAINRYTIQKNRAAVLDEDKNRNEIVLKFRGYPDKNFLNKYKINIIEKRDAKTILGTINNSKLPNQHYSDFEQMMIDVKKYKETDKLRSYFRTIEDIKPVKLDEIIDIQLKKFLAANPDNITPVDITFSSGGEITNKKISLLGEKFGKRVLSSMNSSFVHFCRLKVNYQELKDISLSYSGILHVDFSPDLELESSGMIEQVDNNFSVTPLQNSLNPVIILDRPINANHSLLSGAVISHDGGVPQDHGTGVSSLVVCGPNINPSKNIIQRNSIITIDLDPFRKVGIENKVREIVEYYSSKIPLVIINLSANNKNLFKAYKRKPIDKLTQLIDELSWKYNCLFIISAGNISTTTIEKNRLNALIKTGYPVYFNSEYTKVLPPGDSMNAVCVGSIAGGASPYSMTGIKNPSPHTRGNIEDNCFQKPDLVEYDSNCCITSPGVFNSEDNGPYMAAADDNKLLRRSLGTSFSTPLVTFAAGIIHNEYPAYKNNTIKALLIHSADENIAAQIGNKKLKKGLVGNGQPKLDNAIYSLNTSSTIVVEDKISPNQIKKISIPIPSSFSGSSKKRMRLKMTLVYNPPINTSDLNNYNPIEISARLLREGKTAVTTRTTRDKASPAFSKSNVKRYCEEFSTKKHTGCFWDIEVTSESLIDDFHKTLSLPEDYSQDYSIILSVEDMQADENLDLHAEMCSMIEIDIPIQIEVVV